MLCLHSIVLNCLGSDIQPRGLYQSWICAIGLFLGALINANIFGELSLIMSNLDIKEKEFQQNLSRVNTVMIEFDLPFDLQQEVRDQMMRV